jgi:prolyl 4-hydroxylase
MSDKSFRWRTIIEVAAISVVIYLFLGTPGLSGSSKDHTSSSIEVDAPVAQAKAESLVYPDVKNLQCPEHNYDIHIFSADPLVIYIDGFLSTSEAEHLVDIRYPQLALPLLMSLN